MLKGLVPAELYAISNLLVQPGSSVEWDTEKMYLLIFTSMDAGNC